MTTSLANAIVALLTDEQLATVSRDGVNSAAYTTTLAALLRDIATSALPTADEVTEATKQRRVPQVPVGDANALIHTQINAYNAQRIARLSTRYGPTDSFLGAGVSGMALRTQVDKEPRALKVYQTNELQTFFVALREQEVAHYMSSIAFPALVDKITRPAVDVFDWWRVVASLDSLLKTINADQNTKDKALLKYRTNGEASSEEDVKKKADPAWLPKVEKTETRVEQTRLAFTTVKPIEWFAIEMEYVELDFQDWFLSDKFNNKQFRVIFACTVCLLMQLEEAGVRHNDCHAGNVRLRPNPTGEALTYTVSGATYTFQSTLVPTLADWGRSYVKNMPKHRDLIDGLEQEVLLLDTNDAQLNAGDNVAQVQSRARYELANIKGVGAKHDAYRLAFSIIFRLAEKSYKIPKPSKIGDVITLGNMDDASIKLMQAFLNINTSVKPNPTDPAPRAGTFGNMNELSVLKKVTYGKLFLNNRKNDPGAWYVPWREDVYSVDLVARVREVEEE